MNQRIEYEALKFLDDTYERARRWRRTSLAPAFAWPWAGLLRGALAWIGLLLRRQGLG